MADHSNGHLLPDTDSDDFYRDLQALIEGRRARLDAEAERLRDFLATISTGVPHPPARPVDHASGGDSGGFGRRRKPMTTQQRRALSRRMKAVWRRRRAATRT